MIDIDMASAGLSAAALGGCGVACWLAMRAIRARDEAMAKLAAVLVERKPRRGPFPPAPASRPWVGADMSDRETTAVVRVPEQLPTRVEDACTITVPPAIDATRLDVRAWRVPTVDEMRGWTQHTANGRNWASPTTTEVER